MAGRILDQICEVFERELDVKLPEDALEKCVELCKKYRIDAEELCDTWAAHSHSKTDYVPSVSALIAMEKKGELKKTSRLDKTFEESDLNVSIIETNEPPPLIVVDSDTADQIKPKEPERNTTTVTPKSSFSEGNPTKEYESRKNSGHVVCSFGNNAGTSAWTAVSKYSPLIDFSDGFNPIDSKMRYMYCTMLDKIQSSKEQGGSLCSDIQENNNLKPPVETHRITMETATFAGRILCDGRGKLNASSLLLEGCLFNIRDEKVKLEVNDAPEYCLFPGQVIVIEGKNPDGKRIVAEKIYTDAKPQMYPDFDSVKYSQEPLQIVVASGPFMLSNGSYKPLFDLKQYVIDNQPHVLILIGPFIDAHNPNILQFGGNHCFTRFYEDLITKYVADFAENTQVIVVSSWKDSTLHTVYPTPPIQVPPLPTSSRNKSLKIVPDPSILDISGFHLGVTSSDILLHLSPEELCHSNTSQNVPRLCRIASHLLKQKSFYPLKPSHDDMSIDVKLLANHAFIPKKPHVLVLPSNLKSFINVADDCVIINPERIAKGEYGGSFARIQVKSATEGEKWSPATHISAQVVKI